MRNTIKKVPSKHRHSVSYMCAAGPAPTSNRSTKNNPALQQQTNGAKQLNTSSSLKLISSPNKSGLALYKNSNPHQHRYYYRSPKSSSTSQQALTKLFLHHNSNSSNLNPNKIRVRTLNKNHQSMKNLNTIKLGDQSADKMDSVTTSELSSTSALLVDINNKDNKSSRIRYKENNSGSSLSISGRQLNQPHSDQRQQQFSTPNPITNTKPNHYIRLSSKNKSNITDQGQVKPNFNKKKFHNHGDDFNKKVRKGKNSSHQNNRILQSIQSKKYIQLQQQRLQQKKLLQQQQQQQQQQNKQFSSSFTSNKIHLAQKDQNEQQQHQQKKKMQTSFFVDVNKESLNNKNKNNKLDSKNNPNSLQKSSSSILQQENLTKKEQLIKMFQNKKKFLNGTNVAQPQTQPQFDIIKKNLQESSKLTSQKQQKKLQQELIIVGRKGSVNLGSKANLENGKKSTRYQPSSSLDQARLNTSSGSSNFPNLLLLPTVIKPTAKPTVKRSIRKNSSLKLIKTLNTNNKNVNNRSTNQQQQQLHSTQIVSQNLLKHPSSQLPSSFNPLNKIVQEQQIKDKKIKCQSKNKSKSKCKKDNNVVIDHNNNNNNDDDNVSIKCQQIQQQKNSKTSFQQPQCQGQEGQGLFNLDQHHDVDDYYQKQTTQNKQQTLQQKIADNKKNINLKQKVDQIRKLYNQKQQLQTQVNQQTQQQSLRKCQQKQVAPFYRSEKTLMMRGSPQLQENFDQQQPVPHPLRDFLSPSSKRSKSRSNQQQQKLLSTSKSKSKLKIMVHNPFEEFGVGLKSPTSLPILPQSTLAQQYHFKNYRQQQQQQQQQLRQQTKQRQKSRQNSLFLSNESSIEFSQSQKYNFQQQHQPQHQNKNTDKLTTEKINITTNDSMMSQTNKKEFEEFLSCLN